MTPRLARSSVAGRSSLDGDRVEVTSGVVCGPLCGVGGTNVIERRPDGSWIVTGQTGGAWIS